MAKALAHHPDLSFPRLVHTDAGLEAIYRLFRNDAVTFHNVSQGHVSATAERCRELGEVVVIHDWTEFAWGRRDGYLREKLSPLSKQRQGFYAHYSIAVSADGLRAPLGTVAMKGYVHRKQADAKTWRFWDELFGACDSEGEHWVEGFARADERLEGCSVIHVCDREADRDPILSWLGEHDARFVLRSNRIKRRTTDDKTLREALDEAKFVAQRQVDLSPRSLHDVPIRSKTHPERARRRSVIWFRSVSVEVPLNNGTSISMQVVEAVERRPPKGKEPTHWVLMTSEPTDTVGQLLHVVDIYRSRWMIEEYFKAIKTGCAFRERQLDSASTLLVALAVINAVAWLLLALRHFDRQGGNLPASMLLNDLQLALLQHKYPKIEWSSEPTISEVIDALMLINSYRRSHGPPGWQVLGHGLEVLLNWEVGARLGAEMGLVINL